MLFSFFLLASCIVSLKDVWVTDGGDSAKTFRSAFSLKIPTEKDMVLTAVGAFNGSAAFGVGDLTTLMPRVKASDDGQTSYILLTGFSRKNVSMHAQQLTMVNSTLSLIGAADTTADLGDWHYDFSAMNYVSIDRPDRKEFPVEGMGVLYGTGTSFSLNGSLFSAVTSVNTYRTYTNPSLGSGEQSSATGGLLLPAPGDPASVLFLLSHVHRKQPVVTTDIISRTQNDQMTTETSYSVDTSTPEKLSQVYREFFNYDLSEHAVDTSEQVGLCATGGALFMRTRWALTFVELADLRASRPWSSVPGPRGGAEAPTFRVMCSEELQMVFAVRQSGFGSGNKTTILEAWDATSFPPKLAWTVEEETGKLFSGGPRAALPAPTGKGKGQVYLMPSRNSDHLRVLDAATGKLEKKVPRPSEDGPFFTVDAEGAIWSASAFYSFRGPHFGVTLARVDMPSGNVSNYEFFVPGFAYNPNTFYACEAPIFLPDGQTVLVGVGPNFLAVQFQKKRPPTPPHGGGGGGPKASPFPIWAIVLICIAGVLGIFLGVLLIVAVVAVIFKEQIINQIHSMQEKGHGYEVIGREEDEDVRFMSQDSARFDDDNF